MSASQLHRPSRLQAIGALSIGAGAIHAAAAPTHAAAWMPLGLLLAGVALAQAAFGAAAALGAASERVVRAGAFLHAGVLGAYLISRTSGFPVGPHAFVAEPVGALDLGAAAAEIAALWLIASAARAPFPAPPRRARQSVLASLVLAVLVTATAATAAPASLSHDQGHAADVVAMADVEPVAATAADLSNAPPRQAVGVDHEVAPDLIDETLGGLDLGDACSAVEGAPAPAPRGRAVVYPHDGGLRHLDIATGIDTEVIAPSDTCWAHDPKFAGPDEVVFVTNGAQLWSLRLRTGATTLLRTTAGHVRAVGVHPDGDRLAYVDSVDHVTHALWTLDLDTHEATRLRDLDLVPVEACGGFETPTLEWSPDGSRMLYADPYLDGDSLFVLDASGSDVLPPARTYAARWIDDGTIASIRYADATAAIVITDVRTGIERTRATTTSPSSLTISPDGRYAAADAGVENPAVVVYDLASAGETEVANDARGPIWVDDGSLAVTELAVCTDCHDGVEATGATWSVRTDGTGRSVFAARSTIGAALL